MYKLIRRELDVGHNNTLLKRFRLQAAGEHKLIN